MLFSSTLDTGRSKLLFMSPAIIIIIVNWNRPDDTIACLRSVAAMNYPSYSTIVVDNGSSDDSAPRIKAAFPAIEMIESPQNLGFAGGNNLGIRRAMQQGAEAVLLLNNDTTVDPQLLTAFSEARQRHADGAAFSAKLYHFDDPDRLCMGVPEWDPQTASFLYDGPREIDNERFSKIRRMAYASGCAMFIPCDRIHQLGLLDDRFFCYYEDIEWSSRASRAGLHLYYVPGAKVWHKVSSSTGGNDSPMAHYFRTRNRLLWSSMHASRREHRLAWKQTLRDGHKYFGWRETRPHWIVQRAYWNLRTFFCDPYYKAWRAGMRDYMLHRFGPPPSGLQHESRNRS